jgi:hypothetical protein
MYSGTPSSAGTPTMSTTSAATDGRDRAASRTRGTLARTACAQVCEDGAVRRRGERDEVHAGQGEVLLRGRRRGRGEEDRRGEAVVGDQAARQLREADEVAHARAAQEQHTQPRRRTLLELFSHAAINWSCYGGGGVRLSAAIAGGGDVEWSALSCCSSYTNLGGSPRSAIF